MRFPLVLAVLVVFSGPLAVARAAEVVDQQNDLTGSASADSTSGGFSENGQTFTVGVTGMLSRIEAQVVRFFGSGGDIIVSVYNTSGGFPAGNSLGSRSIPWSNIPTTGYDFQVFDFSSLSIPVTAGTLMAFGVSSTPGGATGGIRSSFNVSTYAGGEAKFRQANPNGPWQDFNFSHDYGFKTYVLTGAAGLPGDFNNDSKVDAGDYLTWRKNDGTNNALPNDNGLGTPIGSAHYDLWRANFGNPPTSGGGLASSAVPEPTTFVLTVVAALGWLRMTCGNRSRLGRGI
jgi:hypothetical protein